MTSTSPTSRSSSPASSPGFLPIAVAVDGGVNPSSPALAPLSSSSRSSSSSTYLVSNLRTSQARTRTLLAQSHGCLPPHVELREEKKGKKIVVLDFGELESDEHFAMDGALVQARPHKFKTAFIDFHHAWCVLFFLPDTRLHAASYIHIYIRYGKTQSAGCIPITYV